MIASPAPLLVVIGAIVVLAASRQPVCRLGSCHRSPSDGRRPQRVSADRSRKARFRVVAAPGTDSTISAVYTASFAIRVSGYVALHLAGSAQPSIGLHGHSRRDRDAAPRRRCGSQRSAP
jgi:hypothetical protein